jgi:uncharacterized protein
MAPYDLVATYGDVGTYVVYLLLGVGFGASLELSGFGDSRKLAAQFYFKDMTVLKVMFTAIIVAAVLIFLSSALGLLEFDRVWVNPTYLWPGIIGGLIMGVGFIVGGFCPGTSLVAASTLKIDGIFFATGVAVGIFAFGESVAGFSSFWQSSYMGRFTIPDWLGVSYGTATILLVLMALTMFYGGEIAERFFGQKMAWQDISLLPQSRAKVAASAGLMSLAFVVALIGQPTVTQKWARLAETENPKLENRDYYAHPGEVSELKGDASLYVNILDVRSDRDYNLFHIMNSTHTNFEELQSSAFVNELKNAPGNSVTFVVSNDDVDATKAWKMLKAQGIGNLYMVDGGINNWLQVYTIDPCIAVAREDRESNPPETLDYVFSLAVGERSSSAHPDVYRPEFPTDCYLATHPESRSQAAVTEVEDHLPKLEFVRKVKIQKKQAISGGCG